MVFVIRYIYKATNGFLNLKLKKKCSSLDTQENHLVYQIIKVDISFGPIRIQGFDNFRKSNNFSNDSNAQDYIYALGATYIQTDKFSNRANFANWLDANEVYILLKKQNPDITQITDPDIISDLNKLYKILKSTKYATKVIVVSNGLPLKIIVTAYASNTKRFEDIEDKLNNIEAMVIENSQKGIIMIDLSKVFKNAVINLYKKGVYTVDYAIIKASELADKNKINANDYEELITYLAEEQEKEMLQEVAESTETEETTENVETVENTVESEANNGIN